MALKATHDGNQGSKRNEVPPCLVFFSNRPVAYPSISRLIATEKTGLRQQAASLHSHRILEAFPALYPHLDQGSLTLFALQKAPPSRFGGCE